MAKHRIVKKRGHGGFWVQKKILFFFWVDVRDKFNNTVEWFAEKEWAESLIKELIEEPRITVDPAPNPTIEEVFKLVMEKHPGNYTTGSLGPEIEEHEPETDQPDTEGD